MSAGHLAVERTWIHRGAADADPAVFQLLLGIAMAGLLVASLKALPDTAWEVVFAVTTAWFDWRLWQESQKYGTAAAVRGQYAPQLAYSAAMLYVFTALPKPSSAGSVMPGMPGMPGMAAGSSGVTPLRVPTLALLFTVLLMALTVRDVNRPASADDVLAGSASGAGLLLFCPAAVKGRQVALGVTLAFVLIVMM
jgi:hypothetical protein